MREKMRKLRHLLCLLVLTLLVSIPAVHTETVHAEGKALVINQLSALTTSKGFKPGSGNYAWISCGYKVNSSTAQVGWQGSVQLTLRVLNSKGKWVYQKQQSISGSYLYGDNNGCMQLKWNGKASKGNEAGVKSGSYVKAGKYKVQVTLTGTDAAGATHTAKKTKSLKVSSSAPSGTRGIAAMRSLPILTGDAEVDYIAEQMIKAAKVTSSMTQEQKVRKIYNWITLNFKHVHYSTMNSYKVYYNTSKLKSKINSYKKKTDKLYASGDLIYNYNTGLQREQWNMERRIGVCNDHAAVFQILCNHVGIDAGVCSGYYLNLNGTRAGHAWNYAVVNGSVYYYDVDVELQNLKKISNHYYWYMKTKSQSQQNHSYATDPSGEAYSIHMESSGSFWWW